MTSTESKFFELLRVALGTQKELISTISLEEWDEIPEIAVKQSVMGLLMSAIEKLPKGQRPSNNILLAIHERVEEIEAKNRYMNKLTYATSKRFEVDGFPNCILKGQGIATLYPNPLRRESGDIDVWLKGKRKDIVKYVNSIGNVVEEVYHHIEFHLKDDTSVEAHFVPCYFNNPFNNSRFQKWAREQHDKQNSHLVNLIESDKQIPVPDIDFNLIFILTHAYYHFLAVGIGLRQIIDYFYVLKHAYEEITESRVTIYMSLLKRFHLIKFASAVTWLLHKILGLPSEYLMVVPNEKEGQYLLKEILLTGNFGQFDKRTEGDKHISGKRQRIGHMIENYPSEATWYLLKGIKRVILREKAED